MSPIAVVYVDRLSVLAEAHVHGFTEAFTAVVRALLRQGSRVFVGELALPLIDLAKCPRITLIGKLAEFVNGVSPPPLGVAKVTCESTRRRR